ncbi:MAG: sulfite exporter TauE/SafE family protein [Clostridia bacterium]|nr:sulfite exporter TauE/SafE family protein [Clostridia bacterium]
MLVWYITFGLLGGVIAGMGMGGGTLLIPLLVVFAGVEQGLAQGINLISFPPLSIACLIVNAKQGLLHTEKLLYLVLPAVVTAVGGALLASVTDSKNLSVYFGIFLVVLGVFFLQNTLKKDEKSENSTAKAEKS